MKILILLFLGLSTVYGLSFSQTKKILKKDIFTGELKHTFYVNCTYSGKGYNIKWDNCKYKPRTPITKKGKKNVRTTRIEWEHVMPAENFGRQFSCWRYGDSKCVSKNGKSYKGRKCCRKISKNFKNIESDPNNLVPAIGELNGDRSNYRFSQEEKNENIFGQYGDVPFLVDFKNRRVYVDDSVKGNIARKYFYMWDKYNLKYSNQDAKLMEVWDKIDPVDEREAYINQKIHNRFGYSNPYISK